MQLPGFFFMSVLAMAVSATYAQTKEEFTGPYPNAPATIREPVKKGIFSPRRAQSFKPQKQNVRHSAQYEFYKRVELAARNRQRLLKQLSKPQYSNFLYFGHKHKPKRRPPNKMRYCSECGIRH
jgi:hypothetical protein